MSARALGGLVLQAPEWKPAPLCEGPRGHYSPGAQKPPRPTNGMLYDVVSGESVFPVKNKESGGEERE